MDLAAQPSLDHVIWPEQFHPKISAIYGLNDIDVEAPSHFPYLIRTLANPLRSVPLFPFRLQLYCYRLVFRRERGKRFGHAFVCHLKRKLTVSRRLLTKFIACGPPHHGIPNKSSLPSRIYKSSA